MGRYISLARALVIVVVVLTAVIIQVALLNRLGLPGASPALVTVVVIGFALVAGPLIGTVVGFGTGLLMDLIPPSIGVVGLTPMVYVLIAFLAGHVMVNHARPELLMVGAVIGFSVLSTVLLMVGGAVFGSIELTWLAIPRILLTDAIYSGILAVGAVPLISHLYRGARDEVGA